MSARFRVLVTDGITRDGLAPLVADDRFELVETGSLKPDALAAALPGMDALLVRSATRVTAEALEGADRLRVIGRAGVGVDTIDVEAATTLGIPVVNAPAGNTVAVAELTFALMLALVRRIPQADRSMRSGKWDRSRLGGSELAGKTLGLVGAGRVGGEVARRARAFGMHVVAYDPFLAEARARDLSIEPVGLDALLERADVVSLHVPLTEATRGLLDAERLGAMKRDAVLVNVARGGVVDEVALADAVREGRLAGAALDVYATEPLPADSPLRALDGFVLTPHLGASTEEAQRNVALEVADAVRGVLLEGDLTRAVNAPAIGGARLTRVRPLLRLAERLGRMLAGLTAGAASRFELTYAGEEEDLLQPLAAAALTGFLGEVVGRGGVNVVSAPPLARHRGLEVTRSRAPGRHDGVDRITCRVQGEAGEASVSGRVLAGAHVRITGIDDYRLDIVPEGALVVLRNRDVPGVIGSVGTVLGEAGINIGEYHQARREAGGEALAAITTDAPVGAAMLARLGEIPDVLEARQLLLD